MNNAMHKEPERSAARISLSELVAGFVPVSIANKLDSELLVTGIQLDSRLVVSGDVFVAVFGRNLDARDFISIAITLARWQCSQSLAANGLASETLGAFLLSPLTRCNRRLARLLEGSTLSQVPKLVLLG
jgi:hypothetical protein